MNNDHQKPKTEVKKRQERKRYLNVIYFIDSKRTRTLKFSIGKSYFTVGLVSAALIWSIVSATLLVRDRFVIAGMETHTQSLLATVFNYQTRYDEVYEKAYPDNDSSFLANSVAEEKAEDAKAAAAAPAPGAMSLSAKALPAPTPKEKVVSAPAAAATPSTEPPLSIDNFSPSINDKTLLIRLSLKNLSSPNKTSGSVRALAKFVDKDNKTYSLESHPRATGDETGNDEHFNIRYFKNKAFYFETPKGVTSGKFLEVTVTIKDDDGRSKDFPYPISKEFGTIEDKPAPPRPAVVKQTPPPPIAAPVVKNDVKESDETETESPPEPEADTAPPQAPSPADSSN
ncbi:MAG: hypothetical protein EOP07_13445 [Proteobacteria bacterium]|nr:MAG: hypothetical protein EOP07_13445 [Pseudomonadota bacterium]